jgi:hypothetical protein
MNRQAKPAESVANDPKLPLHESLLTPVVLRRPQVILAFRPWFLPVAVLSVVRVFTGVTYPPHPQWLVLWYLLEARAVFPPAAFLCGCHCRIERGTCLRATDGHVGQETIMIEAFMNMWTQSPAKLWSL